MSSRTWRTWAEINDIEVPILVNYFKQSAEQDTGTPAGIEIETIRLFPSLENVMGNMTENEIEQVLQSVIAMESNDDYY
jgi:hypothetical protein